MYNLIKLLSTNQALKNLLTHTINILLNDPFTQKYNYISTWYKPIITQALNIRIKNNLIRKIKTVIRD